MEAGLNDGLSVPFMMFFIALARWVPTGRAPGVDAIRRGAARLRRLVGVIIGLAGGWLLGLAKRKGWMAESLQQLGLVALPLLCVIGCEPVGGSMFIAGIRRRHCRQVGFQGGANAERRVYRGLGQLLDFFVFFLFGMLRRSCMGTIHAATRWCMPSSA